MIIDSLIFPGYTFAGCEGIIDRDDFAPQTLERIEDYFETDLFNLQTVYLTDDEFGAIRDYVDIWCTKVDYWVDTVFEDPIHITIYEMPIGKYIMHWTTRYGDFDNYFIKED